MFLGKGVVMPVSLFTQAGLLQGVSLPATSLMYSSISEGVAVMDLLGSELYIFISPLAPLARMLAASWHWFAGGPLGKHQAGMAEYLQASRASSGAQRASRAPSGMVETSDHLPVSLCMS